MSASFMYEGGIFFLRNLLNYGAFWIAGFVGMFPLAKAIDRWVTAKGKADGLAYALVENAYVMVLLGASLVFLIANNYHAFIYFNF